VTLITLDVENFDVNKFLDLQEQARMCLDKTNKNIAQYMCDYPDDSNSQH